MTTNSNVLIGLRMPFFCHIRHNGKNDLLRYKKAQFCLMAENGWEGGGTGGGAFSSGLGLILDLVGVHSIVRSHNLHQKC